jgi:hypothetical protein
VKTEAALDSFRFVFFWNEYPWAREVSRWKRDLHVSLIRRPCGAPPSPAPGGVPLRSRGRLRGGMLET